MDTIQSYRAARLKDLSSKASAVKNVRTDDDGDILMDVTDGDGDVTTFILTKLEPTKLLLVCAASLPDDYAGAGLLATHIWNNRKDAYNTFAYVSDGGTLRLESHLSTVGGVSEDHFISWVEDFSSKIYPFFYVFAKTVSEVGQDSSSSSGFNVAREVLKGGARGAGGEVVSRIIRALFDDN
jgi:hypothetical protein